MKINKTIRIGCLPIGNRKASLFCKIEYDGERLSITGVEGPTSNGNAIGGCGQVTESALEVDAFAEGWTPELARRFVGIWRAWHLNDMRAGCEHQRAAGWGDEQLEIVTYKLDSATLVKQNTVRRKYEDELFSKGAAKVPQADLDFIALPYTTTRAPDADGPGAGLYEVDKRETKRSGHVREDEHDHGVLSKPCPECGYKYGSAWLTEDVPEDVLAFLAGLPDADRPPAWV